MFFIPTITLCWVKKNSIKIIQWIMIIILQRSWLDTVLLSFYGSVPTWNIYERIRNQSYFNSYFLNNKLPHHLIIHWAYCVCFQKFFANCAESCDKHILCMRFSKKYAPVKVTTTLSVMWWTQWMPLHRASCAHMYK